MWVGTDLHLLLQLLAQDRLHFLDVMLQESIVRSPAERFRQVFCIDA